MVFDRFKRRHDLEKYNIHFHGLRHTFSNMLFEMNENPKVIQQLLGHSDVKTTITTYNSVDKSYFQKATDVINKNFKVEESKISPMDMEDDELDEELEKLLREKQARRKRNKDFEM